MGLKNLSGERIRIARKRNGMRQVELSAALDLEFGIVLDQSDVSEIERQVRGVRDIELDAVARILQVSPLWLLRGEEA